MLIQFYYFLFELYSRAHYPMWSEEEFNGFCLSKRLIHELVSISSKPPIGFEAKIAIRGESYSGHWTAVAATSAAAIAQARLAAVKEIDGIDTAPVPPVQYLKESCRLHNYSWKVTYSQVGEDFHGKLILRNSSATVKIPFVASSYTDIHIRAADKAVAFFNSL